MKKSALEAVFIAIPSALLAQSYLQDGMSVAASAWAFCSIVWGISAITRAIKN